VEWFLTGVLIAGSAVAVAYAGYVTYRQFTDGS
jgi:hypothetical protein